jgi:o-succinylbenzoate synthase
MLHYSYFKRTLEFAFDARTSRGDIKKHAAYIIEVRDLLKPKFIGRGEASPLNGLSIDCHDDFENQLINILQELNNGLRPEDINLLRLPSIRFALETAMTDLHFGGQMKVFDNEFNRGKAIPINGLIWMADKQKMLQEAQEKIEKGFNCIKLKVGNLDFDEECRLIESIRKNNSAYKLEIRLDANGAFEPYEAIEKLKELHRFEIHSIEQPIKPKQVDWMEEICRKAPIHIALDEELIGIDVEEMGFRLIKKIKPKYIILKPTLIGGFSTCDKWINLADKSKIGWWLTSALESNVGLNAIAQYASYLKVKNHQGLGTGSLYQNNFPSPLLVENGYLHFSDIKKWNFEENDL